MAHDPVARISLLRPFALAVIRRMNPFRAVPGCRVLGARSLSDKAIFHLVLWRHPPKKSVVRRVKPWFGLRRVNSGLT